MPESWLPVVGWEGLYEISDSGRVRSLPRTDRLGRPVPGCILKQKLSGSSGARYVVQLHRDGETKQVYVHILMLEAFVGPRPQGLIACHKDDSPRNELSNLRWDTYSGNAFDQVANGNHPRARRTHCKRSGHPLTGDNVIIRLVGKKKAPARICRQCQKDDWDKKKDIVNAQRRARRKANHQ